ncbi:MAG TPA: addiction module protein [Spirochaetota bacterium]|jgi:putative addiction module component (TIGR02574 family)|nr:MAG: putative addiction module component [Spirochaetes bacterium ADurb.Bin133]HNZ26126.1 addiction module protein [Spirochaetota bacterium]HPY87867.1 addiction module protein [Spirochaetota bacterium]HQB62540.1 addiction module protein [Spirochaetota bacterium]
MIKTKEKLLSEILKLSPVDKAQIVEDILSSFESRDREGIDKLWEDEVENRISAYEKGQIKTKPLKDVFKKFK